MTVVAGLPVAERIAGWTPPKGWLPVRREKVGSITVLRALGTSWPKRTLFGRIMNYLSYFLSACLAVFQLDRPDVVIALTDPPIIGLAALWAGTKFRCPVVLSYRDLFPEVTRLMDGRRRPLIEAALHGVNRILIRRCDRLVALGEAMRERLIQEKGARPDQVLIIPDWADTTHIVPGPKENPFSRAQGLVDRFVVMHSGNIGAAQNLELLLDAASDLRGVPRLLFVIIGEGMRKASLQARAYELGLGNIRFLPFQPKESLSESFATADCFIISTPAGLAGYVTPSKLYGILAAGRPYVAAVDDSSDIARVTRRYQCGLLVPTGDSKRLAKQIRLLYNNPDLAGRMGANARQAALNFDLALGVQAYYQMCRELMERR